MSSKPLFIKGLSQLEAGVPSGPAPYIELVDSRILVGHFQSIVQHGAGASGLATQQHFAIHYGSPAHSWYSMQVEKKTDIHAVNMQGDTLLHLALNNRNHRASIHEIRSLLDQGLDINQTNNNGATPLHAATSNGQTLELIAFLIERGANVNAKDMFGNIPAFHALLRDHAEILELLLKSGTHINAMIRDGKTLLIEAAEYSNIDIVKMLVAYGADPNITGIDGQKPVDVTGEKADIRPFLAPLTRLSPAAAMKDIICRGDMAALKAALSDGASLQVEDRGTKKNPLHWAVNCGQPEILTFLLSQGLDINRKDRRHQSPLHDSILARQDANLAAILIRHGADPNAYEQADKLDSYSDTHYDPTFEQKTGEHLLHSAITKEVPIELIEQLLLAGANVNVKDNWFYTPLALAVLRNRADYVRILLKHGADKGIADRDGRKPRDHAKKRRLSEIKKLLR